jgi:hypothetical protein
MPSTSSCSALQHSSRHESCFHTQTGRDHLSAAENTSDVTGQHSSRHESCAPAEATGETLLQKSSAPPSVKQVPARGVRCHQQVVQRAASCSAGSHSSPISYRPCAPTCTSGPLEQLTAFCSTQHMSRSLDSALSQHCSCHPCAHPTCPSGWTELLVSTAPPVHLCPEVHLSVYCLLTPLPVRLLGSSTYCCCAYNLHLKPLRSSDFCLAQRQQVLPLRTSTCTSGPCPPPA